jgi:hypothetical protein
MYSKVLLFFHILFYKYTLKRVLNFVVSLIALQKNIRMKKIVLLVFLSITFLPYGYTQKSKSKILVSVNAGEVKVGTIVMDTVWQADAITAQLNKLSTSAVATGYNITHTYDSLGIVLFEKTNSDKTPSGIVTEMQFYLSLTDTTGIAANGVFTGILEIEKKRVTSNEPFAAIKKRLSKYKMENSYTEHTYRLAYKGVYIYFTYNNADTKLLKISIGKERIKK